MSFPAGLWGERTSPSEARLRSLGKPPFDPVLTLSCRGCCCCPASKIPHARKLPPWLRDSRCAEAQPSRPGFQFARSTIIVAALGLQQKPRSFSLLLVSASLLLSSGLRRL